jgi:hypothetical protein
VELNAFSRLVLHASGVGSISRPVNFAFERAPTYSAGLSCGQRVLLPVLLIHNMADPLYLSLWFPSFAPTEMMPRALSVLRQFPFSAQYPGVSYLAIHPISWSEASVLERRFRPGLDPEQAVAIAGEFLHPDYAYSFETSWDLWVADEDGAEMTLGPHPVKLLVHGKDFDNGVYQQAGHIQVDFGLDTPFLYEDLELTPTAENRIKANVQKLVAFTSAVEKNCGVTGRVLWSESDENLAQKLIDRLQKVH